MSYHYYYHENLNAQEVAQQEQEQRQSSVQYGDYDSYMGRRPPPRSTIECKYHNYGLGSCGLGDGCSYRHTPYDPAANYEAIAYKPTRSSTECRHHNYGLGVCAMGDNCRFTHSPPGSAPPSAFDENGNPIIHSRPRNTECRHYMRGYCAQGEACKFVHPTGDSSSSSSYGPQGVPNEPRGHGDSAGPPGPRHPPPGPDGKFPTECRHHNFGYGKCALGSDHCRFRHTPLAPDDRNRALAYPPRGSQFSSRPFRPPSECRHHNFGRGYCSMGPRCRFIHTNPPHGGFHPPPVPGPYGMPPMRPPPPPHFHPGGGRMGFNAGPPPLPHHHHHHNHPNNNNNNNNGGMMRHNFNGRNSYECRHWNFGKGRCALGDNCRFKHSSSVDAVPASAPKRAPAGELARMGDLSLSFVCRYLLKMDDGVRSLVRLSQTTRALHASVKNLPAHAPNISASGLQTLSCTWPVGIPFSRLACWSKIAGVCWAAPWDAEGVQTFLSALAEADLATLHSLAIDVSLTESLFQGMPEFTTPFFKDLGGERFKQQLAALSDKEQNPQTAESLTALLKVGTLILTHNPENVEEDTQPSSHNAADAPWLKAIVDVSVFANLLRLSLSYCDALVDITPLANIRYLTLKRCLKLKEVSCLENVHSLTLEDCPLLESVAGLAHLDNLTVNQRTVDEDALIAVKELDNLTTLNLHNCSKLTDVSSLPRLHTLYLSTCPAVTTLETLPKKIHALSIFSCPGISDRALIPSAQVVTIMSTGLFVEPSANAN